MIQWAEENKIRTKRNGDYEIPQRNGIDWKFDFKFVTKLDSMLANKLDAKDKKLLNNIYRTHFNKKEVEESVNETLIPNVGTIDDFMLSLNSYLT